MHICFICCLIICRAERLLFLNLKENGIYAPFHYIPLHSSPAGENFCRTATEMNITNKVSETLVRLPLYYDLSAEEQNKIIKTVLKFWSK